MNRFIHYIIASLACVFVAACSPTSYTAYSFEQLRAAEYTFPQDVKKIAIVNCCDTENADSTLFRAEGLSQSDFEKFIAARDENCSRISSVMCSMLGSKLSESSFIEAYLYELIPSFDDLPSMAKQICDSTKSDAIIALSNSRYSSYLTTSRTTGYLTLVSALSSQIYFVMPNGTMRPFELQNDTLQWIRDDVESSFPSYRELYYSIADQAAAHISAQMIPSWETRRRSVLGSSSRLMNDAVQLVVNNDWDMAKNNWMSVLSSGNDLDKVRAAINIGLYYERIDNVIESAMWFSKSIDMIDSNAKCSEKMTDEKRLAERLFARSIDRQHEKMILDKQMTIAE